MSEHENEHHRTFGQRDAAQLARTVCEHHSRVPNLVDLDMVRAIRLDLDEFHSCAGRHVEQIGIDIATQIDNRLNSPGIVVRRPGRDQRYACHDGPERRQQRRRPRVTGFHAPGVAQRGYVIVAMFDSGDRLDQLSIGITNN